jgi:surfactin synthase thioesterase subunit/glycosyltransferase involved in cell wall biosynthesis
MRILLAHNSLYFPSHGGGDKSNRLLMESLAERGHEVRVVTRVENFGDASHEKLLRQLAERGVEAETSDPSAVRLSMHGVDVRTLTRNPQIRAFFSRQIADFDPDVIITSTDDPGQLLFDLAIRAPRARVVYLVRATIAVPFGPDSSMISLSKTENLRHADGVVGVSNYVANYVKQFSGIDAIHVPISLLERVPEYPNLGSFDNPYVSMVNPCAVKGITIFLELADRLPQVKFAAVPTWGATAVDMANLRRRPNITLFEPFDDIDDLLRQTKVMLVPSVWAEARSRIVLESMSRGIPVVAADVGGLHEAVLGVDYLLPVSRIKHYKPLVDSNMVPVAEVPPQNIDPWVDVVERLVSDRDHWQELADRSRAAALEYAAHLNVVPFESFLFELLRRHKKSAPVAAAPMSEEKRRLLALRLKQRSAKKPEWFSGLEEMQAGKLTLFCFPYAGGGTMMYRNWREALPETAIVATRLPGRESRLGEPPLESMETLVGTLAPELLPHLREPFVFFGHSMGAILAFELIRWLRENGHPIPAALHVSAARAPQYRLNHQPGPEPDEQSFMEQLRRLEGTPRDVLDNPELMRLALPALRVDANLYRKYVYRPGDPLPTPIHAYGGLSDPGIQGEHLDRWREQTTCEFSVRQFEGGHFYLQHEQAEFLAALRQQLNQSRDA